MKYKLLIALLAIMLSCTTKSYDLALVSNRDNGTDIFITNSEQKDMINITNSKITEYNLSWSKDGKDIYYTNYGESGRSINKISIDKKTTTTIVDDSTVLSVSDVSKNNDYLIISTKENHPKGELYLYNVETQTKTRLTHNELYEAGAKFKNDEKTIVASIQTRAGDSINHSGIAEIFEISIEDGTTKQLTTLSGFNALPEYSPRGDRIAFHHCESGICDIMIMDVDGSNLLNLTKGIDDNRWPRWSPDGKWIAFTKTIDNNSDIYFTSVDGSVIKPIITTEFRDEIAVFKPN